MKRIFYSLALVAMTLMVLVSCKREMGEFSFAAALEQPGVYNPDKNYLQDEHYIMWEAGDKIAVIKDGSITLGGRDGWNVEDTVHAMCRETGVRECIFYGTTDKSWPYEKGWYAVYPSSAWSATKGHIEFPSVMPYRNDEKADFTFGKDCFPMVAYKAAGGDDDLGFHSISGIARFQLFSDKDEIATIDHIEFTSKKTTDGVTFVDDGALQISGDFSVSGWDQWDPLPSSTSTAAADKKITITGINKTIGKNAADSKGALRTFYLPLPATKANSEHNLTTYILEMKVISDKGTFTKNLKVDIRRNCITMMQAIDIQDWAPNTGQTNVHLVGCGTEDRPFQIYTYKELVEARNACNATNGTINGQAIGANTWFKVVRADITLNVPGSAEGHDNSTEHNQYNTYGPWTEGFKNFKGHFRCSSNHPTLHGIVNNSGVPLFESVASTGTVDSVTVRGTININSPKGSDFSPLCLENNGKLSNCVNQVNVTCKDNVAGVCATNKGILYGCRNEGTLDAGNSKNVAGICLDNQSGKKIRYCEVLATAQMSGKEIGGIVHTNSGVVENCYSNINQSSSKGDWGGVAFSNAGTIQHCHVAGSLTTSGEAGGICRFNTSSIVDCYNQMSTLRGSTYVGGIVAYMTNGEIRNCYVDGSEGGTITSNNSTAQVGGLVGQITGGSIENSFCVFDCTLGHSQNNGSQVGGCAGTVVATTNNVKIWNVYSSFNVGFIGAIQGTKADISCCYARNRGAATSGVTIIKKDNTYPFNTYISTAGDLDDALNENITAPTKYRLWQDGRHPVLNSNSK